MRRLLLSALVLATSVVASSGQTPTHVLVPAGAQQSPAGYAPLRAPTSEFWTGDQALGLQHYVADPSSPGQFKIDPDRNFSQGGPSTNNLPFAVVGQVTKISDSTMFLASPDPQKPQQGFIRGAGLYLQQLAPQFQAPVSDLGGLCALTISKGIAGDLPTAAALGPDGKLYYGGLANPNFRRVTSPLTSCTDTSGQQVETFGTALNGQHVLSLAFDGSGTLFSATGDGFYATQNVASCSGNQNNCGRPTLIQGGAAVAVAYDGAGGVYWASALGVVSRYAPLTGVITQIASGFSFAPGRTAGLGFDGAGNLIVGQISEIDVIFASDLP